MAILTDNSGAWKKQRENENYTPLKLRGSFHAAAAGRLP
jgi:hypothetical protein